MPTPVSLNAWLAKGHDTIDVMVHYDRYSFEEPPPSELAKIFDYLTARLSVDELLVVHLTLSGSSQRATARELGRVLPCGAPDHKWVSRKLRGALRSLRMWWDTDEGAWREVGDFGLLLEEIRSAGLDERIDEVFAGWPSLSRPAVSS